MKNVVIVTRQRITGRTSGSSAYLLDIAGAVRAAGFAVHLLHPSPTMMARTPLVLLSIDLSIFASHRARGVLKFGRVMLSLSPKTYLAAARGAAAAAARRLGLRAAWTKDRRLPYSVSIPWTEADHAYMRRQLAAADVVIADYFFQAEAFDDLRVQGSSTAIIMHDLFHARDAAREAGSGRDAVAGIDAASEAAMLARADVVVAIQRAEAAWVGLHVPSVRAILAPMAADPVPEPQSGEDDRLLFVGSNTVPNVIGLRWFFDEVWPLVLGQRPCVTLDVAGSVDRAFSGSPPGVRFLGLVDDLAAQYARAAVVISPLTFGSGLKIKLVEAMAAGKAIVATRTTLQGVEAEAAESVLVADEAGAFATCVISLLEDAKRRESLAKLALNSARRHFSSEVCYADLIAWLRQSGSQTYEMAEGS